MITPEQLAKANTEHAHQCALFCWAAMNVGKYPQLKWLHAIPNGGQRGDGTELGAKIAGGRLKAEGVKTGVHDVFFPCPLQRDYEPATFHGLYIEMKAPAMRNRKNGGMSNEQILFAADMTAAGYKCITCWTWTEAVDAVVTYLTDGF